MHRPSNAKNNTSREETIYLMLEKKAKSFPCNVK